MQLHLIINDSTSFILSFFLIKHDSFIANDVPKWEAKYYYTKNEHFI